MTVPGLPNPIDAIRSADPAERPAASVNGTTVVVTGVLGAVILVLGVIALAAFRPDATATIIGFAADSLLVIGGILALALGNRAIAKRVDEVAQQTNGINTAERSAREQAERDAAQLRVEVAQLRAERDAAEVRLADATTGSVSVQQPTTD